MRYTYDAIIEHDKDGWAVSFPQFPEAVTYGATRAEAISRAADALTLSLVERLEEGGDMPAQEPAAEVVAVSVNVTGDDIRASKCMTMDEAARELGVTQGRVSQLAKSGALVAVTIGGRRMVTIASVEARKANPPAAHRPRKAVATA